MQVTNPKGRRDYVNEWLDTHRGLPRAPRIHCGSGLSLSVQASPHHYCTPRGSHGPWRTVEVGFPSRRLRTLLPWRDGNSEVYVYVPVDKVNKIIARNGGIKQEGDVK